MEENMGKNASSFIHNFKIEETEKQSFVHNSFDSLKKEIT